MCEVTARLAELLLHAAWVVAGELAGVLVQAEEGGGGLAGDQELGGHQRVHGDAGEHLPSLHRDAAHRALWVQAHSVNDKPRNESL